MTDLGWITAGAPLAVAAALLVVPGALALAPLRMGWTARAALAGPLSVMVIGVAGIVAAGLGLSFSIWPVLAVAAVLALCAWLARRGGLQLPREPGRVWPLVLTWVLAAAVIAVVAFAAVPSPTAVSQTYDNVFHLSAIAAILEGGDASSLTLRTLIETGDSFSFYPSGWHSLVALTVQVSGTSIPIAVNAAWLAVAAVVWLPGVAWFAQVCIPGSSRTAALVALPLGAAFGAMPYALLTWGTLYPTYLATALLPAAIAVPVLGWRGWRAARAGARRPLLWWSLAATALVAGAVAFGQPRVLVTWALLLAVPVVGVLAAAAGGAWRAGGAERTRLLWLAAAAAAGTIAVAAVGFWYLVTRLGLFERPLDDRLGGPQAQAVQSLGDGVWQVLAQSWLTGVGGAPTWPAPLLAAGVLVGLVVAWRAPRTRWLVGSYALVAALYVLAAGSDDVVTKLATALWYKDKYRLSSALVVVAVVVATLGVMAVSRWIGRRVRARAAVAVGLAWLVAGASAVSLGATGVTDAVGYVFRMPDRAVDEVVSSRQIAFFSQLDDIVPEGQRVAGDPWDGSAWTQVFGGPEPVFPHVNGQWDADRQTIAWHLADIESNPQVCDALDRLMVRYVTYAPRAFGGGDPAGNHFPGPHAAVEAGLFTLVATDGETSLYRIDQCGPLEHAPAS
ncbi:hypothetical protein NQ156_11855 [Microbacterium sp. zg.Y625]|uniref:DUF6541 family protein n=1 Tax=Microbacterium jiangjiandongii TaxID=3049071 RepID=UPI00214AADE5|nr:MULTISPECIES: DUF6541 family protein [unclassified Microbacterium]MCR2793759.1 hypothetical protein [Microbacterium sp. zg.Y625]WIM26103.1 hypothetical protein QNO14_03335 [Microbacterium sp. zg-Y625]